MSTTTLKATARTWLKAKPSDSRDLVADEKVIIEEGSLLELDDISSLQGKHYKVDPKGEIDGFNHQFGYVYSGHWAIVDTDDPDILKEQPPTNDDPAVQRQIDRLSAYLSENQTLDLDVKTKNCSQRDNYTMPHRTCNRSSNYMYLAWLRAVTGKPALSGDDEYLKQVLKYGDTIFHYCQTEAIADFGFRTKWMTDADLPFIKNLVTAGFPVVCNILHRGPIVAPRGGHIIMLIGRKAGQWITHDPYGTLASDYRTTNGAYSKIRDDIFRVRWQGGYRSLKYINEFF